MYIYIYVSIYFFRKEKLALAILKHSQPDNRTTPTELWECGSERIQGDKIESSRPDCDDARIGDGSLVETRRCLWLFKQWK